MSQELDSVAKLAFRLGSIGCLLRLGYVAGASVIVYVVWHFLQRVW